VLDVFGCTVYDPYERALYLSAYPYIRCAGSDPYFPAMAALAAVAAVAFVAGLPLAVFAMLYRARHRLADSEVATRLGFAFSIYRPGAYMWEVTVTLRRLLLALIVAAVPFTAPLLTVIFVVVILQTAAILTHAFMPFKTRMENALELGAIYVLLLSFVGAFAASVNNASWFLYLIVVLHVAVVGLFALAISVLLAGAWFGQPAWMRVLLNPPAPRSFRDPVEDGESAKQSGLQEMLLSHSDKPEETGQ
jgi:hypothetical protein